MVKYIAACLFVAASYLAWTSYPVTHGPGVTAKDEPHISWLTWQKPFTYKGATISPQRVVEAEVRIIKKKRYFFDDYVEFSSIDALVGWDSMSDERNLDHIHFDLANRKAELSPAKPPLKEREIHLKSDLWHFIPSTNLIEDKIKNLRNGHVIFVKGLFVNLENERGLKWSTSKEIDGDNNKRFILWVEELEIR